MQIIKTSILMIVLMLLFMIIGYAIGGQGGMVIAFLIACATNFFSYFFSDKIVLKHYNAILVTKQNASGLYDIVEKLCKKGNLPLPKICIIPDPTPNAFATGRNPKHAVVAVTEGLLNLMSEEEVEAVIAHELSHVKHYDILTGSIAAVFAGAIAILANIAKMGAMFGGSNKNSNRSNIFVLIALAVIAPLAATIIQLAISRSREFEADRGSAELTSNPNGLIKALSKLESYSKNPLKNADPSSAHMFIVNPLSGKSNFSSLFRTHPSTEERIKALEKLKTKA